VTEEAKKTEESSKNLRTRETEEPKKAKNPPIGGSSFFASRRGNWPGEEKEKISPSMAKTFTGGVTAPA